MPRGIWNSAKVNKYEDVNIPSCSDDKPISLTSFGAMTAFVDRKTYDRKYPPQNGSKIVKIFWEFVRLLDNVFSKKNN